MIIFLIFFYLISFIPKYNIYNNYSLNKNDFIKTFLKQIIL